MKTKFGIYHCCYFAATWYVSNHEALLCQQTATATSCPQAATKQVSLNRSPEMTCAGPIFSTLTLISLKLILNPPLFTLVLRARLILSGAENMGPVLVFLS